MRRENRVLKIAVAELERVSERDTLTPLFNRRYFLTAIHHRMARFERHAERAAVVFIDVNQLKYINDSFGHAAGDFALMEIAKRLASSIRATDVAARIGGDEFGLILDQSSEDGARAQVDRLCAVLTAAPAEYDGHEIALSACFGIAVLQTGMTESDILAAADRDMYRSKQGLGGLPGHR
ncbi:diguanylate cyclase/phosphodiesterase [Sphingopyxis sp. C-1]|nr:diguanylate cyclase/phosphodiesterase [Sphingopyxis sp. C-1]